MPEAGVPSPPPPPLAYRLLSLALVPFWFGHAWRHGHRHRLPGYLRLRLGMSREPAPDAPVWIHAASVGEVNAVAPLARALAARGETLLFTSFTATGYRAIERQFGDAVARRVIPLDFAPFARRFIAQQKPRLGLIMETELWPELLYAAARARVPLLMVNARLSPKTTARGPRVRAWLATTLGYFASILARGASDREALIRLGARADDVIVAGNLKTLPDPASETRRLVEQDYVLLASSHEGEELRWLELRPATLAGQLVVIAPRHPERGGAIERELAALGQRVALRSRGDPVTADVDVYVADTLGELESLMAFARVVVMGGSFDQTGGHNLIEPARLGCATVTGPSDGNIREDIRLLGDGVIQVGDLAQCWRVVEELLADPGRAAALGRQAQARLAAQPDVLARYLELIDPWLAPGTQDS